MFLLIISSQKNFNISSLDGAQWLQVRSWCSYSCICSWNMVFFYRTIRNWCLMMIYVEFLWYCICCWSILNCWSFCNWRWHYCWLWSAHYFNRQFCTIDRYWIKSSLNLNVKVCLGNNNISLDSHCSAGILWATYHWISYPTWGNKWIVKSCVNSILKYWT
jgi:hypothetical protein